MDLRVSTFSSHPGPRLASVSASCGDLGIAPPHATVDLLASQAWSVWGVPGGWMIQALRRLNEPASESHLGMALAVAAVVMGLMLWAILWQANIIAFQRDLIRLLSTAQFGGMG